MIALGGEPLRDHLSQDPALDRAIARLRISPPPAVPLHCPRGGDEPDRDRIEIGVEIIQAEDQRPVPIQLSASPSARR